MTKIKSVYESKVFNKNKVLNNVMSIRRDNMKKYVPFIVGGVLVCTIVGFGFYKNQSRDIIIDYPGYLTASKSIESEKNNIKSDIDLLYSDYINDKIDEKEYFDKLENLKDKYEEASKKADRVKEDFDIKDDMDLDKVKFSSDKELDKELKELYQKKLELDREDEKLDLEEDKLEEDYKNKLITKEEYISKKRELDLRDDMLDREEDALDILEDKYDIDDDDDDDVDDDDVDDDDDDDKDDEEEDD